MKDWTNITVEDFYKLKEIEGSKDSDEIKQIKKLAFIIEKPFEEVQNYSLQVIQELSPNLLNLSEQVFSDAFEKQKKNKISKIKLNGKEYVVWVDIPSMTYAQFVAFQEANRTQNIPAILSSIIIPKGKKYGEDYDMDELQNDIQKYMYFVDAQALLFFFAQTLANSLNNLVTSSIQMMSKMKKKKTLLNRIKAIIGLG
jgi:hypothetical protein